MPDRVEYERNTTHSVFLFRQETWWVSLCAPRTILRASKDERMDRVAVFIDGSNFYNKLKDLGIRNTPKFDYRGLAEWLAHGRTVVYCGYYVGVVRAKPGDVKA